MAECDPNKEALEQVEKITRKQPESKARRCAACDEAIKRLRHLLSIPAGGVVSIARLKIDPVWDPIRNRPDFQQLLSGPEQIGPNK